MESTKSISGKKFWETLSPEERMKRVAKMHKARNKRWREMTPEARSEHARKIAKVRWGNK